jgi:polysaccharide export outer membrane protein
MSQAFCYHLVLLRFRGEQNPMQVLSFPKRWEVNTLLKLNPKATYGLVAILLGIGCYTAPVRAQSQTQSAQPPTQSSTSQANPPAQPNATDPADMSAAKPAPNGYRIGVDDSLYISVWREPDLSSQVMVRPDGVITLPLINDVKVVGLTPEELKGLLTDKLKPFVNEPQVTVIVRDIRSRKVFLVGQVGHPGTFIMSGDMGVTELLAQAGGLSQFAKSESIYVLRNDNGHQTKIPFKYKRVIEGKMQDVKLVPGDMVVVP